MNMPGNWGRACPCVCHLCLFQCVGVEGKQAQQRSHYLSIGTCDRWRPRKRGRPTWGTSVACRLAEQSSGPLQRSNEMRWLLRSFPLGLTGPLLWEAGEEKYIHILKHTIIWTVFPLYSQIVATTPTNDYNFFLNAFSGW